MKQDAEINHSDDGVDYLMRLGALQTSLIKSDLDGFIVTDRADTFYLTGFRGSYSIMIVLPETAVFLTDARYYEAAAEMQDFMDVVLQNGNGKEQLKNFFDVRGKIRIGFDPSISYHRYQWLSEVIRPARLVQAEDVIKSLRLKKDANEITNICKAGSLTDQCMSMLVDTVNPGMTEKDIMIIIRRFFEDCGAEGVSFPTIVASGSNSSVPHHRTSNKKIDEGEILLIDTGCIVNGYCSDITRTFFTGENRETETSIYNIVLRAQKAGIDAVRPGLKLSELDSIVRGVIEEEGYGDTFIHRTGHGVGIEVHEPPSISSENAMELEEGMVITIEPGIYLPGHFGVRIEDLVLVTSFGCKRLTEYPRDIRVIAT